MMQPLYSSRIRPDCPTHHTGPTRSLVLPACWLRSLIASTIPNVLHRVCVSFRLQLATLGHRELSTDK